MNDGYNDTPPPQRVKSEYGLKIPIDLDYIHHWRRENAKDARDIHNQLKAISERMIEGNFKLSKHDDQIRSLAEDIAETDRAAKTHHERIISLERLEELRMKLLEVEEKNAEKLEKAEERSPWRRFFDGVYNQAGVVVVGIVVVLGYFILEIFFKAQP